MLDDTDSFPDLEPSLFRGDCPDRQNNACVNQVLDSVVDAYASGYKLAADVLVRHTVETSCFQDELVYPIVFLYRHYVELRLKEIIEVGGQLTGLGKEPKQNHFLPDLWAECRPILESLWPEPCGRLCELMGNRIVELDEVDHRSTAFRYPRDSKGEISIRPDILHINLRNLSDVMGEIAKVLDGASIGIDAEWQVRAEMKASWVPGE